MARPKAGEINKSQAVREYIAKHKRAKAATVVEALAAEGIEVPASLVYNIRGQNRTKRGTIKTSGGKKTSAGNGKVAVQSLLAAKKLVETIGGIEKTREVLKVLEQLA